MSAILSQPDSNTASDQGPCIVASCDQPRLGPSYRPGTWVFQAWAVYCDHHAKAEGR